MTLWLACAPLPEEAGVWSWDLPSDVPEPRVPEDNPMTPEKVALGRHLFYDTRLSANETQSCGSCHEQALAWTDGRAQAEGSTGELHPRGAMGLINVSYAATLSWANPSTRLLEDQALVPLFGEDPIELGMAGQEALLLERLRAEEDLYGMLFAEAYPQEADPITLHNVVGAIASFERALVSFRSPYDRMVLEGEWDALSERAKRGMALFFSEDLECFHCHGGLNFSDSLTHSGTVFDETPFHNNGLYNLDGRGAYPADNTGLYAITGVETDMGRFKAPSLRNIALTAPYMHDGSLESLEAVIAHYARGGTNSPYQSAFINGFAISPQETQDLIAFLESLTDEHILQDPRLSSPF